MWLMPWQGCLFHNLVGIPCPLCGLTRSMIALARADVGLSLRYHPAGWLIAVLAGLTILTALVNRPVHRRLMAHWARWMPVYVLLLWGVKLVSMPLGGLA